MVPVLVVDKWRTFAEALSAGLGLATGIMVVGVDLDVETAVRTVQELGPVVVVVTREYALDLLAALERQSDSHGLARVVVLAETGDETAAGEIIRAGCAGWVRRDASVDVLVDAIRAVAANATALPAALLARAITESIVAAADPGRARQLAKLTPRQAEILTLMEAGMGRRDIAYSLRISPGTVRAHVQRISGRLGVHSAAEAVSSLQRRD